LSDPTPISWTTKVKHFFLDLDARVDTGLFKLGQGLGEYYERFSIFMDRFQLSGGKRWCAEIGSEAATLGLGGLIVALALAVPAFRETADDDWLRRSELAVTFLDRYGNEVGSRGIRHNDSIPLEEFPDHLIKAVLATEDRRFYEHFGIDFAGTVRAFTANARAGGVVQGGSSITQQLAKNLFLSNERTIERKVKEAFLAIWLETRLSKNDILKLYLDRAYMGGGTFGVDAAAQYYFGKSVRDVNLSEAAMLAGLFKAPTRFAPHVNLPAARGRAATVLDNLVDAGFMTEGQVFGARRNPATAIDRRDERSPNYYLDWAFDEMKRLAATLPSTVTDRVFVVRTGLDTGIQREAESAVENALRQYGAEYHASQAGVVMMDLDGTVRALVGGRDYGASQFNRATDALRQPGSSFKPYVYATAFENGFGPNSIVRDDPICLGNWCPQNYGRSFAGAVTLTTALVRSINTIPVRLSLLIGKGNAKAGRAKIIENARKMGLQHPLTDSSSLPIGAAEVTILEHTAGFTAFPNQGRAMAAHAVIEVRNTAGELIWRHDRDGKKPVQVLSVETALGINRILNQAVEAGTGRRALLDNGIKAAGKTGTTNAYRDAWFVGYTGNYVAGVWYGNDDYSPTNRMTGGSLPAMTWRQIMNYAHQGIEARPIPGVAGPAPAPPATARRDGDGAGEPASGRPAVLTSGAVRVLSRLERRFEAAKRPGAPAAGVPASQQRSDAGDAPAGAGVAAVARGY